MEEKNRYVKLKEKKKMVKKWDTNKLMGVVIICFTIIIIILVGHSVYSSHLYRGSIQDLCLECNNVYGGDSTYTVDNVNVLINKIKEDCGSTHITKQFGETEWSVFKTEIRPGKDGVSYTKIENCLKKTR